MRKIISLLLLVFSWSMVFFILMILTEFILVPWDTATTRPEIGTWQRTLNDFFALPPGDRLIAGLLVTISIVLTWRRHRFSLLVMALGNLIFAGLAFSLFMGAALVNNMVFPYPPVLYDPAFRGYHRSIIPGLTIALLCVVWLGWQLGIPQPLRAGARRSEF